MRNFISVVIAVAFYLVAPMTGWAKDDLSVALTFQSNDRYVEPLNKRFQLGAQPLKVFIRVRNLSSEAQEVNAKAESAYSFELTDEKGTVTILQYKRKAGDSKPTGTFTRIGPDQEQITEVMVDPATWEGVPEVAPGSIQEFKFRVRYLNHDGKILYSPVYTMIIDLRPVN